MTKLQKDTYVTKWITHSLIKLLEEKELKSISISEITTRANVSRSSFYRNFDCKEAILRECVYNKIKKWQAAHDQSLFDNQISLNVRDMWISLFHYLKEDQQFFMLVQKRGLLYLIREAIQDVCGPKPDHKDELAFFAAFMSYGIYGWIEEWIKRDMKDERPDQLLQYMNAFSQN